MTTLTNEILSEYSESDKTESVRRNRSYITPKNCDPTRKVDRIDTKEPRSLNACSFRVVFSKINFESVPRRWLTDVQTTELVPISVEREFPSLLRCGVLNSTMPATRDLFSRIDYEENEPSVDCMCRQRYSQSHSRGKGRGALAVATVFANCRKALIVAFRFAIVGRTKG